MPSHIDLPDLPASAFDQGVGVWSHPLTIDTYLPEDPDPYPAFLDRRVYQGSSGRVYPLPFHERISQVKKPVSWQAIHIENDWLRVVILPELGGRIHVAYDKVAGYDMFYRNNVIKPALVGLAGPWISGGIEFNWPQHHRPATFLPTDVEIVRDDDGTVTVWCSDHDPFARMKGMHGIRISPTSSRIEAHARLYNRSETQQTFLWWANVAAAVNDDYQSFFPKDVTQVADHAKRAVVDFPRPDKPYYGIDYPSRVTQERPDADRLDWYRNIPVPTSYMALDSAQDFFGGYDHGADAGFVHVASHTVSPGKKQWTWGNAPFGWAWDRNLTDTDGPYVELMAGVYTDNQPDFAFLDAGETKTFVQSWFPIRRIGPAAFATDNLAVGIRDIDGQVCIGICAADVMHGVEVSLQTSSGQTIAHEKVDLDPAGEYQLTVPRSRDLSRLTLVLQQGTRRLGLFALDGSGPSDAVTTSETAVAPPAPEDVTSIDELILIATYLDQYRHATRSAVPYLTEALTRDPHESRALLALGRKAYEQARYLDAEKLLAESVARRTAWTSTPATGDAHYLLGLTHTRLGQDADAATAFSRASWDARFAVSARFRLAQLRCRQGDLGEAARLLEDAITIDPRHLQSIDLLVTISLHTHNDNAPHLAQRAVKVDPLDAWARFNAGLPATADATTMLDVALEFVSAGFTTRALRALNAATALLPTQSSGQVNIGPLIHLHEAALALRHGDHKAAVAAVEEAARLGAGSAHPSRLDDIDALQQVAAAFPSSPLAVSLLGHWLYDKGRFNDAMTAWNAGLTATPEPVLAAILHRNLGLASYNVQHHAAEALEHYRHALDLDPTSAKLVFEYDQLQERTGASLDDRLLFLETRRDIIFDRDDLTIAFARLLASSDRATEARAVLQSRVFQPWEGGEGQVLAVWDWVSILLAREALGTGRATDAVKLMEQALTPPESLGEGRHDLANVAELHLTLGDALAAAGNRDGAHAAWTKAAMSTNDFLDMSYTPFSGNTIHAASALDRLGRTFDAEQLIGEMQTWLESFEITNAEVDFFATSLPSMLLFVDSPNTLRDREAAQMRAQIAARIRHKELDTSARFGLIGPDGLQ